MGGAESATDQQTFRGPPLTGALAGGGYGGALQATSADGRRLILVVRHGSPSPNIDFGTPRAPPGIAVTGQTITGTVSAESSDLGAIGISTVDQLRWLVQFNDLSDRTPSVVLPSVPAGIEDPLSGTLQVSGYFRSLVVPFDPNDFVNTDFDVEGWTEALTVSQIEHEF